MAKLAQKSFQLTGNQVGGGTAEHSGSAASRPTVGGNANPNTLKVKGNQKGQPRKGNYGKGLL